MEKSAALAINSEAVKRLESILNDSSYREAVENSANYNTHLCLERKTRLPFLDAQTGVAQSDSNLWMPKWQRMPGQNEGQLYTYPARRWKKKRWQYLMNDRYLTGRIRETDATETDIHQISVVENTAVGLEDGGENSLDKVTEDSKDSWFREYEDVNEFPDLGDPEDPETDFEDFEETYSRKKKRKVRQSTRGRKRGERIEYTDAEKPYSCEICGARYKTRPGLSYHYTHSHNNSSDTAEEEPSYVPPKTALSSSLSHSPSSSTGTPADDPLAAHPTCLQFTPNMTASVKQYRWQCIECKSCGLCGTSDNDDQLLFCDDCDRGYHMYCLNPPLSNPPEGSWSCHLCIEEYHGGRIQMG
ncbi:zinc finger protein DPF3-like isoform X5 [Tachypleus tridentatus]|uniref:zinc finger protein DPF3-like isoform X5 n=1 Tax=Tachypleus tridentatus TaxID=6853 RepID=UPI003FD61415